MSLSLHEVRMQICEIRNQNREVLAQTRTVRAKNEAIKQNNQDVFHLISKHLEIMNERQKELDAEAHKIEQLELQIKPFKTEDSTEQVFYDLRNCFSADAKWLEISKAISSSPFLSYVTLSYENHVYFDAEQTEKSCAIEKFLPSRRIEIDKSAYAVISDYLNVAFNCFANAKNLPYFIHAQEARSVIHRAFFGSNPVNQDMLFDFRKATMGSNRLVIWISDDETCCDFQVDMRLRMSSIQRGTVNLFYVAWTIYRIICGVNSHK